MRFLNLEATMEKARAYGRAEGRAEARAEAQAQARAENDRAWEAWNQRREAAASRHESFNEPPPSQGWEATIERAKAFGRAEGRGEGRVEGRAEGRAETHRAWEAWNQRREAAAERNEPFNEPPPSQVQG